MLSRKCLKICLTVILLLIILTFILPFDPSYSIFPTAKIASGSVSNTDPQKGKEDTKHEEGVKENVLQKEEKKDTTHKVGVKENVLQKEDEEKSKSYVQDAKLFVILVTGFRTGSTFLGELFNQNPDVLYMFEPFHQNNVNRLAGNGRINGVTRDSSLLEKRTGYLEQITQRCELATPSFYWMSKGMSCGTEEENIFRFGTKACPMYPQSLFSKTCRDKKTVALKLIRLQRLAHLDLVPGLKNVNFRVIHLIRDPRGTMNSRRKFPAFYIDDLDNIPSRPLTEENLGKASENLCIREMENLEFSERLPDYIKNRYLRVTHDEISLWPIQTAETVYKFVGRPIPPLLGVWLEENTTEDKHKGVLGTGKDSKAVLRKWKSELKLEHIRVIETKCNDMIKFMGYQIYDPNEVKE